MMHEFIQIFFAGAIAGVVMTCLLFAGPFQRAMTGWERARNRIEDLEDQVEQLRTDDEEDWRQ